MGLTQGSYSSQQETSGRHPEERRSHLVRCLLTPSTAQMTRAVAIYIRDSGARSANTEAAAHRTSLSSAWERIRFADPLVDWYGGRKRPGIPARHAAILGPRWSPRGRVGIAPAALVRSGIVTVHVVE